MKIAEKTNYAFLFMLHLGLSYGEEYVKLSDISAEEHISEKYLESIVGKLRPAGFIISKKGSSGGHKLAVSPDKISLLKIFEVINGTIMINESKERNYKRKVIQDLWLSMERKMLEVFAEKTLDDLIADYRKNTGSEMYYI